MANQVNITDIPANFQQTIVEGYGARGRAWLDGLPALLAEYERRWSLTIRPPFELSYNYVAPAVRTDGTEVVLKAGVPNPELLSEMAALRLCDGRGLCRLLEADEAQGVMLLERVRPGTPLATVANDDEATLIAAGVMEQIWRPLPAGHPFRSLASWTSGLERLRQVFEGGTGPFPRDLVETAERLRAELLVAPGETVLLHGDCHHWNILRAERQPWLVIDPKGVAGEAIYDATPFLYNRLPEPLESAHSGCVLARRIDILAERLGFDRQRLIGWAIVQSVLSSWWTYEDHGRVGQEALATVRHLVQWI